MRFYHLAWKELWHRKAGTLLILAGVTACVALIVCMQVRAALAIEKMRRDMLRAGRNIIVLPRGLSLHDYRKGKLGTATLPQSDISFLAKAAASGDLPARRFLGSLQRRTPIQGQDLVLVGLTAEQDPLATAQELAAVEPRIEIGQADLGCEAARRLDVDPKAPQFIFLGTPPRFTRLKVRRVLPPSGTVQDDKVFVDIAVAQKLFGVGNVINVIEAMSLTSATADLKALEDQIARRLAGERGQPRVNVYHRVALAVGRARAEHSIRTNTTLFSALALIFGVIIIAGYAVLNARERRREMGILLAIAARPRHLAGFFLQKMLLLGVLGGALGCLIGGAVGVRSKSAALAAIADTIRPAIWSVYTVAFLVGIALAVLPSLAGVYIAARTDPADTLRDL